MCAQLSEIRQLADVQIGGELTGEVGTPQPRSCVGACRRTMSRHAFR